MEQSILTSTKKILGIAVDYTEFDLDIITHINAAFSTLHQLGIGPTDGFMIVDADSDWDAFTIPSIEESSVKTYVYLKVRLLFDPPGTSFLVDAIESQLEELVWRMNTAREYRLGGTPDGASELLLAFSQLTDVDWPTIANRFAVVRDELSGKMVGRRMDTGGMALAVSSQSGEPIAHFDDFSMHPDGLIHGKLTHGTGAFDSGSWNDAYTVLFPSDPVFADAVLEEAHIVDGVLRHRGTRVVCSAAVNFPGAGAFGHAITLGFTEELTTGPGGGYPALGVTESGYASTRVSFVDGVASNGYVGYVQSADDVSDHEFVIVRDTAAIPTIIGGPWTAGRRLNETDVWTFRHDGNIFTILLNGIVMGRVVDNTYSHTTFDATSIVLNSSSVNLPGCRWWAMALTGFPSALYIPTDPENYTGVITTKDDALNELAARVKLIEQHNFVVLVDDLDSIPPWVRSDPETIVTVRPPA